MNLSAEEKADLMQLRMQMTAMVTEQADARGRDQHQRHEQLSKMKQQLVSSAIMRTLMPAFARVSISACVHVYLPTHLTTHTQKHKVISTSASSAATMTNEDAKRQISSSQQPLLGSFRSNG